MLALEITLTVHSESIAGGKWLRQSVYGVQDNLRARDLPLKS